MIGRLYAALALIVVVGSLAFGSGAQAAQEATPEAGETTTEVTRTDVRLLLPFGPDGLRPDFTVATTVEGVCNFTSIVAFGRPDAWDCISADNEIFDPCFEPPLLAQDELGQLACIESPFTREVTLVTLTEPLMRQKQVIDDPDADPSPGMSPDAPDDAFQAWDLPWALELANGDQCTLLHGTLTVLAGQVVSYGCVNGGIVLGEMDRSQRAWTVSYLADGEVASTLVDVAVAWS